MNQHRKPARRILLRTVGIGAAVLCGILAFSACGRGRPVLNIYTWADYFKPDLIRRFEKENACRVVIDTFDSNEAMYAKIKAGATGYDLLTPSSYMVSLMRAQDMLGAIDRALVPNLVHVDPEYLKIAADPDMGYSVPYMVSNSGLAYLRSRVPGFVPSWGMFDRADLKGRMTMLNDMRESIGAALKFLGYSLNSTDEGELAEARDVVLRWKANIAKFENEQYKTGIASGEFLLVHSYSGDILQVRKENPDIVFAIPEEGTAISIDDLVIPRTARRTGLAHAFINFLHDPAVAAENTEFLNYLCPNRDAYPLLGPELRENPAVFMSPELRAKSEIFIDLGPANALYVKVWDEIKSAR
jgi:spermidine/putrescine transport system substrate-binding protein